MIFTDLFYIKQVVLWLSLHTYNKVINNLYNIKNKSNSIKITEDSNYKF